MALRAERRCKADEVRVCLQDDSLCGTKQSGEVGGGSRGRRPSLGFEWQCDRAHRAERQRLEMRLARAHERPRGRRVLALTAAARLATAAAAAAALAAAAAAAALATTCAAAATAGASSTLSKSESMRGGQR